MDNLLPNALVSIIFALLGFILLFIGYKVLDALTPADLGAIIFEEGNTAAAIFSGAFILGLAIVVAAAIH